MSWSALHGSVGLPGLLMYAACSIHTMFYDTIYSHQVGCYWGCLLLVVIIRTCLPVPSVYLDYAANKTHIISETRSLVNHHKFFCISNYGKYWCKQIMKLVELQTALFVFRYVDIYCKIWICFVNITQPVACHSCCLYISCTRSN